MRILQVSPADVVGGGAEKIAWNLFTVYRELGHDSRLAVGHKRSSDPDVHELSHQPGWCSIGAIAAICEKGLAPLMGRVRGASQSPPVVPCVEKTRIGCVSRSVYGS